MAHHIKVAAWDKQKSIIKAVWHVCHKYILYFLCRKKQHHTAGKESVLSHGNNFCLPFSSRFWEHKMQIMVSVVWLVRRSIRSNDFQYGNNNIFVYGPRCAPCLFSEKETLVQICSSLVLVENSQEWNLKLLKLEQQM